MASLTETAYYTRKGVNFTIIGLVVFLILKFAIGYALEIWAELHPPPPPPPSVAFGQVPQPKFPESSPSANLVYSLDTISGNLPTLPAIGKVYFMPTGKETLLSLQRAQDEAKKLGFTADPVVVSSTVRQWTDSTTPLRTLRYDIATGNFDVKYDWSSDASLFVQKDLPDTDAATTEARNFFANLNLAPDEIINGKTSVTFYQASLNKLIPTSSVSSADLVRVDFFRNDLDQLPLLSDAPTVSPLYVVFSGIKDNTRRFVEIHFTVWQIETETFSTYPLRPVSQAWNDLNSGKGYIASMGTAGTNLISIRNIYLAYYYPFSAMEFLEPVYVFEGDKGFTAYVPGISTDWLAK
ncbi:MAG: hypothetical protein M1120_04030 [Patescibacteria group bacterium]|nr:hypothetical protein [Patescibacteria group bacterium]